MVCVAVKIMYSHAPYNDALTVSVLVPAPRTAPVTGLAPKKSQHVTLPLNK